MFEYSNNMANVPKKLYFIRHEHSCANQLEKVCGTTHVKKGKRDLVKRYVGDQFQNKENIRSKYASDPNITYFGVKHALHMANNEPFKFHIDSLLETQQNNSRPVKIYCSQLVRTAETALVLFHQIPTLELHIIPFINEKRRIGRNKDNEPTTIQEYKDKFDTFFRLFKDSLEEPLKESLKSPILVFYNEFGKVYNEYVNAYFTKEPNKKRFINFVNEKIDDNSFIVTHSKFLEELDTGFDTKEYMTKVENKPKFLNGFLYTYHLYKNLFGTWKIKIVDGHNYNKNKNNNVDRLSKFSINLSTKSISTVLGDHKTVEVDIRDKDILGQIHTALRSSLSGMVDNTIIVTPLMLQILNKSMTYCTDPNYKEGLQLSNVVKNIFDNTNESIAKSIANSASAVNKSNLIEATLGGSKKPKKKPPSKKKKSISKRKPKVYTGKRGGQYIIKNKRKVYLSSTQR